MNAMILLVCLAGADGAAPVAQPAQKHIHPAPAGTVVSGSNYHGSSGCCDSCGHHGHSMFGKLRGLFHRSCDDGCKTAGCGNHGTFHHRNQVTASNDGGHKLFGFLHRWRHNDCCEPACKESHGHKLRERFHGIFRKHDDCAPNNCCNGAAPTVIHAQPTPGAAPALIPAKPAGEKAPLPQKKLPTPEEKKTSSTLNTPPAILTLETPVLAPRR